MIRFHFGAVDLRRITFVADADPLQEVAIAARALGCDLVPPWAHRWARHARPRLRPMMRPLLSLVGPRGFPDFLTPEYDEPTLESAVAALAATPADVLQAELPPASDEWIRDLAAGRPWARRDLTEAVRTFHDAVVKPWSATTNLRISADLATRSRALLRGGVDELLRTLHPDITWNPPVLTTYPAKPPGDLADVRLGGRGLRLYPSALISNSMVLDQPDRAPMLLYPMLTTPYDGCGAGDEADPLAQLLGRTRAAVLRSVAVSGCTSQVARRIGVANASASEHTRVLRNAALLITVRRGGVALHSLTPLGHRLLADPAASADHVRPARSGH